MCAPRYATPPPPATSCLLLADCCTCCRDNIVAVFGTKAAEGMEGVEAELEGGVCLAGYVSKASAPSGRAAGVCLCCVRG